MDSIRYLIKSKNKLLDKVEHLQAKLNKAIEALEDVDGTLETDDGYGLSDLQKRVQEALKEKGE